LRAPASFKRLLGATFAPAAGLPFPSLIFLDGRGKALITFSRRITLSLPLGWVMGAQPAASA